MNDLKSYEFPRASAYKSTAILNYLRAHCELRYMLYFTYLHMWHVASVDCCCPKPCFCKGSIFSEDIKIFFIQKKLPKSNFFFITQEKFPYSDFVQ